MCRYYDIPTLLDELEHAAVDLDRADREPGFPRADTTAQAKYERVRAQVEGALILAVGERKPA